jgi:hypothetical protein
MYAIRGGQRHAPQVKQQLTNPVSNQEHLKRFHKCCSHRPVAGPGSDGVFTSCEDGPQDRGYSGLVGLDSVGSVLRWRRWSWRRGMLIMPEAPFAFASAARLAAHLAFIAAAS